MPRKPILAPSILSADMANLAQEVKRIEAAGLSWVHLDVMDGRFVPNLTFGIPVVQALRQKTRLVLDVHLMIEEPERYTEAFAQAGADRISVHPEATRHLHSTLEGIRQRGVKSGVALCPATPLSVLEYVLEKIDQITIMTVEPGFGGQHFIPAMVPKIAQCSNMLQQRKLPVDIAVDGGINKQTIGQVAQAGANVFVAGSAIFGPTDLTQAAQDLLCNL